MPTCERCGREFKNDLALKIHIGKQHGKIGRPKAAPGRARKARKVRGPAGRKAVRRAAPGGPDVRALTVDQLIATKQRVDDRLADIARQMRAARVRE